MKKKLIALLLTAALVAGAGYGASRYYEKSHTKTVDVTSVENLASDYYMDDTTLDANIVSSATQNITVDNDLIIQEVHVSKGDTVQKGQELITFDMTLVQMELNIAKLQKQQQEQELTKAENRLTSLQNGGPIEDDSDTETYTYSSSSTEEETESTDDDLLASLAGAVNGTFLAASFMPVLAAAETAELFDSVSDAAGSEAAESSGSESEFSSDSQENGGETAASGNLEGDSASGGEESGSSDADVDFGDSTESAEIITEQELTPTPTPEISSYEEADVTFADDDSGTDNGEDVTPEDDGEPVNEDLTDGEPYFYTELDGDSVPYSGTGTEEDPYLFFVSSAKGYVIAKGSFLNKMAGYQADGTKPEGVTGYWYLLEFHTNDTVDDLNDRKASCSGYYLVDGSLLESMVNDFSEVEFTLDGASQYLDEYAGDSYAGSDDDGGASTMSREEAIKQQKTKIESLELDIRESELDIKKLEKKVAKEVIYSKLEGTVTKLGDPETGAADGDYFMTIKSKEGFYVKGTVGELMLDQMEEGTKLKCSGDAGEFEAEVIDVSDYPVSSDSTGSYGGSGNPNVSYYTFTASIPDQTLQLSEDQWLTVSLAGTTDSSGIVLDKALVRSENGVSYVYKDDGGVLKKQIVTVGGNVNSGYSVLVKSGLTRDDKIAFPYSEDAQEGALTNEVSVDTFYGY